MTIHLVYLFFIVPPTVLTAHAGMWKYVDQQGSAHFVAERAAIPPRYRDTAKEITQGVSVAPNAGAPAPVAAHAPAAAPQSIPAESVPAAADDASHDVEKIQEAKAAAVAQVDAMNAVNPALDSNVGALQGFKLPVDIQKIQQYIGAERFVKLMSSVQDPAFAKNLNDVASNPNRTNGLIALTIFSLFLAYLKNRAGKSDMGFVSLFLLKIFLFVLFLAGSATISYVVYGEALANIVKTLYKALA